MSQLTQLRQDDDKRYHLSITLMREGRPQYWEFHCFFCTAKVCDVDGNIVHVSDVSYTTDDVKRPTDWIRCPGTNRKWCRFWYGFMLYK